MRVQHDPATLPLARRRFVVTRRSREDADALVALGAVLVETAMATPETWELAELQADCALSEERRVSPRWLEYQRQHPDWISPGLSPLFKPLPSGDGIPEMHGLVICLTGLRGEMREHARAMIDVAGATHQASLDARTTHLVCAYGDATDAERRLKAVRKARRPENAAVLVVRHEWLHLCLRAWNRLDEEVFALPEDEQPRQPGRWRADGGEGWQVCGRPPYSDPYLNS